MLQCLFMNNAFRAAVHEWRPKDNINAQQLQQMQSLQKAFAYMQYTNRSYFDPQEFAESLELNNLVQQDAQEFNKLLMTHLEGIFSQCAIGKYCGIVHEQFRGNLNYVTQCLKCNQKSKRSSSFYEIELNFNGEPEYEIASSFIDKDNKNKKLKNGQPKKKQTPHEISVKGCLRSYLKEEYLTDDNRYFCDNCNMKTVAMRRIELMEENLPPVLTIQLMRFVYDVKTLTKQKLKNAIGINEEINLSKLIRERNRKAQDVSTPEEMEIEECENDSYYDLVAILNHQGDSANVGHYTADVKCRFSTKSQNHVLEKWFEFDDDVVRPSVKMNNKKNFEAMKKSKNAYMLLYQRRSPTTKNSCTVSCNDLLKQEVDKDNEQFTQEIKSYTQQYEALEVEIDRRKQMYDRGFRSYTPYVLNNEDLYYWIDADWLKAWITGISDGDEREKKVVVFKEAINMRRFLCQEHKGNTNGFSPQLVESNFKRISQTVFNFFKKNCGVEFIFSSLEYRCEKCCETQERASLELLEEQEHLSNQLNLILSSDSQKEKTTSFYLISRKWFVAYRIYLKNAINKKIKSAAIPRVEDITQDLVCQHGFLSLDKRASQKISNTLWQSLTNSHKSNIISFPADTSQPCSQCLAEEEKQDELTLSASQERHDVLKKLQSLFQRKTGHPSPRLFSTSLLCVPIDVSMFLLPRIWLNQWRNYIQSVDSPQPPALHPANAFRCSCTNPPPGGNVILIRPLRIRQVLSGQSVSCEEFATMYGSMATSDAELITQEEWENLNIHSDVFKVIVEPNSTVIWQLHTSSTQEIVKHCIDCEKKLDAEALAVRSNFEHKPIHVKILRPEQELPQHSSKPLNYTSGNSNPKKRRRSLRSNSRFGQEYTIKASSNDSILVLKYKVLEQSNQNDFLPSVQSFYFEGKLLDNQSTLIKSNIKVGDTIYCRINCDSKSNNSDRSKLADSDDFAMLEHLSTVEKEVGFKGSVFSDNVAHQKDQDESNELTGIGDDTIEENPDILALEKNIVYTWSCKSCTFTNTHEHKECEICHQNRLSNNSNEFAGKNEESDLKNLNADRASSSRVTSHNISETIVAGEENGEKP